MCEFNNLRISFMHDPNRRVIFLFVCNTNIPVTWKGMMSGYNKLYNRGINELRTRGTFPLSARIRID
jgi:hypothetical protein